MHSFRKHTENDLPPLDVRFTELRVEPWPDGRRVRVHVDITPFQQNPDLEATVTDQAGLERARTLIVETADHRLVFTLHLRGELKGAFTLSASLAYRELGIVDSRRVMFEIHPPDPEFNLPL